jgi:PEGA domain
VSAPVAAAPARGSIVVETQPAGAHILLDGKPAGDSPLRLDDVPPGRHVVTVSTASASVKKVVRVEPGKTISVDLAVYSGWVAIYSPILLDVSEAGQALGTTEQSRLMLPPGHHTLTLTNRELGYTVERSVDIEPGEERTLNIQPQGVLSVNALPWAEIWIDGKRAGDTPLANVKVALGTREVIFKHPQYGERRMTITVRASAPSALTIDMAKPPDR